MKNTELKEIKNKMDFLESHNKNYNKTQYYYIIDIKNIIDKEYKKAQERKKRKDFKTEFQNIAKNKIMCFEFDENDRVLYVDIEKNFLIAGGVCNTELIKEYQIKIDYEETVDRNLENFYNYIVENMEA